MVPPRLDSYSMRMRNLHSRYGLSKNVTELFIALDNHRLGVQDSDALGRTLRMSSHMRILCTDTIASLAEAMQKNPTPDCISECTELIKGCTDMLALASKLTSTLVLLVPETCVGRKAQTSLSPDTSPITELRWYIFLIHTPKPTPHHKQRDQNNNPVMTCMFPHSRRRPSSHGLKNIPPNGAPDGNAAQREGHGVFVGGFGFR